MRLPQPPFALPPVAANGTVALGKRIVGFAIIPYLSLVAPFIFLPVLARVASPDVWVAIALGQSVGGMAGLVAGFGYQTLAPPMVAVASAQDRRRILATSVHVRLPVWAVAAVIASTAAALLAPDAGRVEAAAMAFTMSLAALAPTWYWIGVGRALPILWYEVLPRMAATIAATGILLLHGPVMWYPVLLATAMLGGPAFVYGRNAAAELVKIDRDEVRAVLRRHPPAVIAEAAAGVYNSLAVAIVASIAPAGQAAHYISGDKAYRVGQYSVGALGNALQGWVVEAREGGLGRRLRIVIVLHASMGMVGLAAFGMLGPLLTDLLFGPDVAIGETTAFGFGVAILGIALGTAFGRIGLITIGARKAFMTCVLAASVAGALGLVVGGALWGAEGAAWALGITELLSALAQGTALAVLWRKRIAT
jgi:O-antigen/teichoic acid export membrane protein